MIRVGRGTKVTRSPATFVEVAPGPCGNRRFRLRRTITLEFEASVVTDGPRACHGCGVEPKLDARGAAFILAHNDGDRLHFADRAKCEKDRDRFPATGWGRTTVDGRYKPVCHACRKRVRAAKDKALRGRRPG